MNLLIINQFGKSKTVISDILPRIGDRLDLFYEPCPEVTMVLLWPTNERLKSLNASDKHIDAVIAVK